MNTINTRSLKNGPVDLILCCVDNFEARMTVNRVIANKYTKLNVIFFYKNVTI